MQIYIHTYIDSRCFDQQVDSAIAISNIGRHDKVGKAMETMETMEAMLFFIVALNMMIMVFVLRIHDNKSGIREIVLNRLKATDFMRKSALFNLIQ